MILSANNIQDFYKSLVSSCIEQYSNDEVEALYSKMLSLLPNDGKLYKYRHFKDDSFSYTYDGLSKGYLYLSPASKMNDEIDTSLYLPQIQYETVLNYLKTIASRIYLSQICCYLNSKCGLSIEVAKTLAELQIVDNCIDIERGKDILFKAGISLQDIDELYSYLQSYTLEKLAQSFIRINQDLRSGIRMYCMSSRNDVDSMWAYYGNDNHGFCIEYDFSKALQMSTDIKRTLLNMCSISYSDERKPFSIEDIIYAAYIDPSKRKEVNYKTIEHMLHKNLSWQHESEWRILLHVPNIEENAPLELPVDLVSGIYIDQKMVLQQQGVQNENVGKLLSLAKLRGWEIHLRRLTSCMSSHEFAPYTLAE